VGPGAFKKTNHLAVVGFVLPFFAAGLTGALLLVWQEEFESLKFSICYMTVVPLVMLAGLISSLKSIPLIEERGDKDYAYSGLTMNVLFLCIYVFSLVYFHITPGG
jgi:hypothetical protein